MKNRNSNFKRAEVKCSESLENLPRIRKKKWNKIWIPFRFVKMETRMPRKGFSSKT